MPSRRKIREAATQFLYCADLEGGADPSALREPFWEFVTESDRRRLLTAVFRTVLHLAHGRAARIDEWRKRQHAALELLIAWPEAGDLASLLERLERSEDDWGAALESMQRLSLDGDDPVVVARLQASLDGFFTIDRGLSGSRQEFLRRMDDFPQLAGRLEPVAASTRRLQRISERLRMVEDPGAFPEQADLDKLRASRAELEQLRSATDELVDRVNACRAGLDRQLASVVENYSPERIDPVDRAILRLAAYEIRHTDTPRRVVINEAVELAKRYGTQDSARFVNGILDRIEPPGGGDPAES